MKFEFSVDIPTPIELVWKIAQNPELRPSWDVRIANYQVHGPQENGTEVTIKFRVFFFRPVGKAKFILFNPPKQSILRIEQVKPAIIPTGGGTWMFQEIENGTRMVSRFNLDTKKSKFSADWLTWFFVWFDTTRSLKKLRKLVLKKVKENEVASFE